MRTSIEFAQCGKQQQVNPLRIPISVGKGVKGGENEAEKGEGKGTGLKFNSFRYCRIVGKGSWFIYQRSRGGGLTGGVLPPLITYAHRSSIGSQNGSDGRVSLECREKYCLPGRTVQFRSRLPIPGPGQLSDRSNEHLYDAVTTVLHL